MSEEKDVRARKLLPTILLVVAVVIVFGSLGYVALRKDQGGRAVASAPRIAGTSDQRGTPAVGGEGSPEYNRDLAANDSQLAEQAELSGRTHISSVVGAAKQTPARPSITSTPPEKSPTPATQLPQPRQQARTSERDDRTAEAMRRAIADQAARLNDRWQAQPSEQRIVVMRVAESNENPAGAQPQKGMARERGQTAQTDPAVQAAPPAGANDPVRPGALFYAVNDLSLNSDNPGPIMATIAAGPLKGAKALGEFKRSDEKLTLTFSKLALANGSVRQMQAYGVDPETSENGIRTAVDNHYLERWGGLVAASFLQGFGEAKSASGSVTTSSYGTTTASVTSNPYYSVGDQTWIAAGKVGERLADKLAGKFDRAPTVTLQSGQPIGILVIDAH